MPTPEQWTSLRVSLAAFVGVLSDPPPPGLQQRHFARVAEDFAHDARVVIEAHDAEQRESLIAGGRAVFCAACAFRRPSIDDPFLPVRESVGGHHVDCPEYVPPTPRTDGVK